MTVETSPDWLPPGWTLEFRYQKTGRRITQYVNQASGQRFFTKDDLIRYTKTECKQCADQLPTLRKNTTLTVNNQAVVSVAVVEENERPEWLPKNWLMEVKTRKNGVTFGRRYKIYVDPLTGRSFQSKPQVLQFLGHVVSSKRNREQKKRESRSRKKAVIEKSTDDDLPSGWTKEVKIRRKLYGIRKYPYYTDPVSGYVFRSKTTALHYLETGEIAKTAFLPKKDSDDHILTNADESQLPATKRKKVKRLAGGRELDVGGETSDRSISPDPDTETFEKGLNNNDHAETALATSPTLQVLERKGSLENAITRNPDTAEKYGWRSSVACKASNRKQGKNRKVVSADNVLVSNAAADETENMSSMNSKNSCKSENVLDSNAAADETENMSSMNSKSSCKSENKKELNSTHSEPEVAKQAYASTIRSHCGLVEKIIKPIEDRDILGKHPQKLQTEKTSDSKSEVQPLFSSEQCLEHTMRTRKGRALHEEAADEGLVSTPASDVLQEKNLGKTRMESKRSNVEITNSSKFKKMKELDLPCRFSIPFSVLEHEHVVNEAKPPCVLVDKETRQLNVDTNTTLPHQVSPVTVNTVLDNISRHEVSGEQPLMSEIQKGSDIKLEVQHLFCSDPCLEFAIKTLTGAIPLEDAISEGLVLNPIANVQQQKNLTETRTEHSSCKKALFNPVGFKRKDVGLQQGSSKQLVGHATELVANHFSNEQVLDFAAGKIYDNKAIRDLIPVNPTVKSSQQLEIGSRTTFEHQNLTYNTTLSGDISSSKSKEPHKNKTVPAQTKDENPRQPSAIPFGSSWSDWSNSVSKSPFKTLTSSSPSEHSFAIQWNFHQPFGRYANSAPLTGQPVQQQQFPSNPPSRSLPKNSTTGAKKSYRKGKKKLPAKEVKS